MFCLQRVKVTLPITIILLLELSYNVPNTLGHPPPPPKIGELVPTESWLNKSCNMEAYQILFDEKFSIDEISDNRTAALIALLTSGTFESSDGKTGKYFSEFLDKLCLSIDKNKVIDMHSLDCISEIPGQTVGLAASCDCGLSMNSYDPNVPQPETRPGDVKIYSVTKGLNRKLIAENGTCVSGYKGHCNTTLEIPLNCASALECQPLEVSGRFFQNRNSSDIYGLCERSEISEETIVADVVGSGHRMHKTLAIIWLGTFYRFSRFL